MSCHRAGEKDTPSTSVENTEYLQSFGGTEEAAGMASGDPSRSISSRGLQEPRTGDCGE